LTPEELTLLAQIDERLRRIEEFFHIGPGHKITLREADRIADEILAEHRPRKPKRK
jgi:hypothetical protein